MDWLPIIGENYEVAREGRVRNVSTGVILKTFRNNKGYHVMTLYPGNRKFLLHRLVAIAFVANPDHLPEVNHEDGNKDNCAADNLNWATHLDNVRHAMATGLGCEGERHGMAKMTSEAVVSMREDRAAGSTLDELAEKYRVTFGRVGAIVRGDSWKRVGGPLTRRGLDHGGRSR